MLGILDKAKQLTAEVLSDGSIAVDATLGNGHDAVHLAKHIAPTGRLFGVDLQPDAVRSSRDRLERAGWQEQATLLEGDHADLEDLLPTTVVGAVDAVMFNLGYLPGSDHSVTTRPESTVPALEQAVRLLRPGGRVTVVMYRGHPGGAAEYQAVMQWATGLDQERLEVLHYRFANQIHRPPELLAVEKR